MASKKLLPPWQTCQGCKRKFRSYKKECPWCLTDGGQENRTELATMAEEARRQRREGEEGEASPAEPVPYGEFPPGF